MRPLVIILERSASKSLEACAAEENALPYKRKYFLLQESVRLIADRLAAADQRKYTNADTAIDDARDNFWRHSSRGRYGLKE